MRTDFIHVRQFSWVAAGAAVVGAGVSIYKGVKQKQQAKQLQRDNPRPTENVPNEIYANQQLAQNMSLNGLPSEQYEQAKKNIQRQQLAAMGQAQDRRSGVASIGAIQQGTNDAMGGLDAANAAARHQNQLGLIGVNNQVGQWKDRVFDWNERQKYLTNQQYSLGLLGAGNQNVYGGIDKLLGGAFQAYGSGAFSGSGGTKNPLGNDPNLGAGGNPYGTGGPQTL